MKVNWIQSKQRLPDKSGYYWVKLPEFFEDEIGPIVELAEWYADTNTWSLLGLSELVFSDDDESFPTHWATTELPDTPEDF